MIEALIMSVLGSFVYDNLDFLKLQTNNIVKVIIGNGIIKIEM